MQMRLIGVCPRRGTPHRCHRRNVRSWPRDGDRYLRRLARGDQDERQRDLPGQWRSSAPAPASRTSNSSTAPATRPPRRPH